MCGLIHHLCLVKTRCHILQLNSFICRNTILALGSFLDTFQKIADSATNTRGATREIGACLTRIVIRHKAMEARMKTLSSALLDCLVLPLAEKMEEWRKVRTL